MRPDKSWRTSSVRKSLIASQQIKVEPRVKSLTLNIIL